MCWLYSISRKNSFWDVLPVQLVFKKHQKCILGHFGNSVVSKLSNFKFGSIFWMEISFLGIFRLQKSENLNLDQFYRVSKIKNCRKKLEYLRNYAFLTPGQWNKNAFEAKTIVFISNTFWLYQKCIVFESLYLPLD